MKQIAELRALENGATRRRRNQLRQVRDIMLRSGSRAMNGVREAIERLGPTDLSVLLTGETGTGKSSMAKDLHARSRRKDAPFVVADMAGMSETIVESELFGSVRGAYTGAVDRAGFFEVANGGTLLLEEIGEASDAIQKKLLRALQDREIVRVGTTKPIRVDVRVISATSRNLRQKIEKGEFQAQLYYRLAQATISLPPLRDRDGDVRLLAESFFAAAFGEDGRLFDPQTSIHEDVYRRLESLPWPGNVRQLENVCKACFGFAFPDSRPETETAEQIGLDVLEKVLSMTGEPERTESSTLPEPPEPSGAVGRGAPSNEPADARAQACEWPSDWTFGLMYLVPGVQIDWSKEMGQQGRVAKQVWTELIRSRLGDDLGEPKSSLTRRLRETGVECLYREHTMLVPPKTCGWEDPNAWNLARLDDAMADLTHWVEKLSEGRLVDHLVKHHLLPGAANDWRQLHWVRLIRELPTELQGLGCPPGAGPPPDGMLPLLHSKASDLPTWQDAKKWDENAFHAAIDALSASTKKARDDVIDRLVELGMLPKAKKKSDWAWRTKKKL